MKSTLADKIESTVLRQVPLYNNLTGASMSSRVVEQPGTMYAVKYQFSLAYVKEFTLPDNVVNDREVHEAKGTMIKGILHDLYGPMREKMFALEMALHDLPVPTSELEPIRRLLRDIMEDTGL